MLSAAEQVVLSYGISAASLYPALLWKYLVKQAFFFSPPSQSLFLPWVHVGFQEMKKNWS